MGHINRNVKLLLPDRIETFYNLFGFNGGTSYEVIVLIRKGINFGDEQTFRINWKCLRLLKEMLLNSFFVVNEIINNVYSIVVHVVKRNLQNHVFGKGVEFAGKPKLSLLRFELRLLYLIHFSHSLLSIAYQIDKSFGRFQ